MDVRIEPSWKNVLQPEFEKPYFINLTEFVRSEYQTRKISLRQSLFSMLSTSALLIR